MKISAEHIQFDSLGELKGFIAHQNLFGVLKFSESIVDNTGKTLVKENIVLKESMLEKLENITGQFPEIFKVALTKDILKRFREAITVKVLKRLEVTENDFLKNIYQNNLHNYEAYIRHSLQNKNLLLAVFKISSERENFFNHIAELGLLSMGIIIQKFYRVKMIHRYSFLTGLCTDLVYADTNTWKNPAATDKDRNKRATEGADFISQFKLPLEIHDVIAKHAYSDKTSDVNKINLDLPVVDENDDTPTDSVFDGLIGRNEETEESDSAGKDESYNEMLASILIESLRIARYIDDVVHKNSEREFLAEEMIYYLAYNAEKGFFHKDLVNPLIEKFKQYKKLIYRAQRMAQIENMCLHPPSAWVYPKPNASQVMCTNRILDCPKLVSGWDIHVISPQEAFGWIGVALDSGNYPKCGFETHLEDLVKEIETDEFKSGKNLLNKKLKKS